MGLLDRFIGGVPDRTLVPAGSIETETLRSQVEQLRGMLEQRAITELPWNVGADPNLTSPAMPSPNRALKLAPVYGAVSMIARSISTMPLHPYRKTGNGRNRMPYLPQLFRAPSIHGDLTDWLHRCMTSLLLWGNAYGLITARDGMGFPTMVEWLDPMQVQVLDEGMWGRGSFWDPIYYWRGRIIDREQLVHIPWFTVPFRVKGMSPMGALAAAVDTGLSGQVFTQDWYKAGGVPPGTFKNATKTLTPAEAADVKNRLVSAIRSHEPIVYGSDWDYKPITINPRDAVFVETHQLSATDIAVIYGIYPAERIGGVTKTSMTYCVDTETEMLTQRGWLKHDEARVGDIALTLNMQTGKGEWQPVLDVNRFEGPHEVLRMKTMSHSSVSTLDHRWPVLPRDSDTLRIRESQELRANDRILAAAPISDLPSEPSWLSDSWVELVAWFYTEGYISPHGAVTITQSERVNPECCQSIRKALRAIFGSACEAMYVRTRPVWVESPKSRVDGTIDFRLNKLASKMLLELAPDKVPSMKFLTQLTRSQLELFVDTSIAADGWTTPYGTRVMTQKDRRRIDALQIACALIGISGNVRLNSANQWQFALQSTPYRKPMGHAGYMSRDVIEDSVWCPTTANGTWFARREGTCYFTHNTNVEAEQIQWANITLQPYASKLESHFFDLLPDPQYVKFALDATIRSDTHTRYLIHQIRREIGLNNIDEIRDMEDMAPLPNGMGQDYNPLIAVRELIRSAAITTGNPNMPGFQAGEPTSPGSAGSPQATPGSQSGGVDPGRFTAQLNDLQPAGAASNGRGHVDGEDDGLAPF